MSEPFCAKGGCCMREGRSDGVGRYVANGGMIQRWPPALRWASAVAMTASAILAPQQGLPVVALLQFMAYYAGGLSLHHLWRDLRPLLWHLPFLCVGTLLVTRNLVPASIAEISSRIVLSGLPIFWLQRVSRPTELLNVFQHLLPFRIRLLLLAALRMLPILLAQLAEIRLVHTLQDRWPTLADWKRPRWLMRAAGAVAVSASVRVVKLSDDMASALEGRGLDRL
jgi:energy-coupling factor transporter transmembrane protein EcfT